MGLSVLGPGDRRLEVPGWGRRAEGEADPPPSAGGPSGSGAAPLRPGSAPGAGRGWGLRLAAEFCGEAPSLRASTVQGGSWAPLAARPAAWTLLPPRGAAASE